MGNSQTSGTAGPSLFDFQKMFPEIPKCDVGPESDRYFNPLESTATKEKDKLIKDLIWNIFYNFIAIGYIIYWYRNATEQELKEDKLSFWMVILYIFTFSCIVEFFYIVYNLSRIVPHIKELQKFRERPCSEQQHVFK